MKQGGGASSDLADRYRGALLGLAVGDALGTTLEFAARDTRLPVTGMTGGGPFYLKPGQWTDDTSMAVCLAESLIERDVFDPVDQMQRYLRWLREGYNSSTGECFDIGGTTGDALYRFEREGIAYAGSDSPATAGNGSLMRLAPVALRYRTDLAEAVARAADSSRTTHAAAEAVDACCYFAALLVAALSGLSRDQLLSHDVGLTPFQGAGSLSPAIAAIAAGSFKQKDRDQISSSGYVANTLEAALWAFYRTSTFRDGALLAVNLAGDADTVGAVYGQLAGAVYGARAIPAEWLAPLTRRDYIETLADRLLEEAIRSPGGRP